MSDNIWGILGAISLFDIKSQLIPWESKYNLSKYSSHELRLSDRKYVFYSFL